MLPGMLGAKDQFRHRDDYTFGRTALNNRGFYLSSASYVAFIDKDYKRANSLLSQLRDWEYLALIILICWMKVWSFLSGMDFSLLLSFFKRKGRRGYTKLRKEKYDFLILFIGRRGIYNPEDPGTPLN